MTGLPERPSARKVHLLAAASVSPCGGEEPEVLRAVLLFGMLDGAKDGLRRRELRRELQLGRRQLRAHLKRSVSVGALTEHGLPRAVCSTDVGLATVAAAHDAISAARTTSPRRTL